MPVLEFSDNQLDERAATALTAVLRANRHVTTLRLARNRLGSEGARTLAAALEVDGCAVTSIDISDNAISSTGGLCLAWQEDN